MDTASEPFESTSPSRRWRFPIQFSAGLVIVVLLVALAVVVTVGVLLSRSEGAASGGDAVTTIAALRADPEGLDLRDVVLRGTFEDVRTVPYLDQYALYTFRDETGSMRVLSRNGAPAGDDGQQIELRGVFHSRVKLDEAIRAIVEERLGGLAGSFVGSLLPGVPLDVVFIEHTSYETIEEVDG